MKYASLLTLGLLVATQSLQADVRKTEEMTFEVAPGARISLENINGDITVTGENTNQVHVIAHKKADNEKYLDGIEINVQANEDEIQIETEHPDSNSFFNWGDGNGGSVTYELTVPFDSELDDITSVNGEIVITGVTANVRAETVNGSISVKGLEADGRFETVNGGITAQFNVAGEGQKISAEAVNGGITLILPSNASARVSADTVSGSIKAGDFGLEADKGFVGQSLEGSIGNGDARLSVDTVNGSIRIKSD